MMPTQPLIFVHLSDLHIRWDYLRSGHDLDTDLRNELRRDLRRLLTGIGQPTGILLGGDVAFAGKAEEYVAAVDWLRDLSAELGIDPKDSIWVVPGNHDVDRSIVQKSVVIRAFQAGFRGSPPKPITHNDDRLREYLVNDPQGHTLLAPLGEYSHFALRYGCPSTHEKLYWEKDFPLNDGSTLRLRGVNSAIISGPEDDDALHKLVLGSVQATMSRADAVAYMLLCHHPPDWLLNHDDVEDLINSRAAIQLFGHKHRYRSSQIEGTVRISAGALHPDRNEAGWEPRYNVLQIQVEGSGDSRALCIRVWPRRWNAQQTEFGPDGSESWERCVPLEAWYAVVPAAQAAAVPAAQAAAAPAAAPDTMEPTMPTIRELAYDFYDLPYQTRMQILLALGLLREEERGLPESEREARIFRRIEAEGLLGKFQQAIETHRAG